MKYTLIKLDEEFWLLDKTMAKNEGEFFAERHLTGEWCIYEVHTIHDTVHDGFKILGSTKELPNIAKLDSEKIIKILPVNKKYTPEDIRSAMLHMANYMKYRGTIKEYNPLYIVDQYERSLEYQWLVEVEMKSAGSVVSGGFIPEGVIGGRGLQIHENYTPSIQNGEITIKSII